MTPTHGVKESSFEIPLRFAGRAGVIVRSLIGERVITKFGRDSFNAQHATKDQSFPEYRQPESESGQGAYRAMAAS
jgi:hypothetical protein